MKLQLPRITMTTAHAAFSAVDSAIAAGDIELDLSAVSHPDSSLVALVLHAHRGLSKRKLTLRIVNAPTALGRLLAAYGIESLLDGTLV